MQTRMRALASLRNLGLVMVFACAGPGRALAVDGQVEKIPADLKSWQVTATSPRGPMRPLVGPIRAFDSGKYECELWENFHHMSLVRGTLPDAGQSAVLTMVRAIATHSTFDRSSSSTADASHYEFSVSSGSRVIHMSMYPESAAGLGISEPVNTGMQVLNRAIRAQPLRDEFTLPRPGRIQDAAAAESRSIVPKTYQTWQFAEVEFLTGAERIRLERTSDRLRIYRTSSANPDPYVQPKAYSATEEERDVVFRAVRDIVNGFSLGNDDTADASALPRCRVGVRDEGKSYSVEFPIDGRLPKEWLADINQVSLIGRKKDDTFPLFGTQEPGQMVGNFDGRPIARIVDAAAIDDRELVQLSIRPAWERFLSDHKADIAPHDEEIDAYMVAENARVDSDTKLLAPEVSAIDGRFAEFKRGSAEWLELADKRRSILNRMKAVSSETARALISHWKAQRTLYDEFGGGDVVLRGDGLEAIDAEQEMLSRAIRDERLVIPDQTLRERVLGYYAGVKKSSKVLTAEEKESQFLSPTWAKGVDEKGRPE